MFSTSIKIDQVIFVCSNQCEKYDRCVTKLIYSRFFDFFYDSFQSSLGIVEDSKDS